MGEQQGTVDATTVWGVRLKPVHCAHCGEAHLVPANEIPSLCPLCRQGPVETQPAILREEPPEQVVPYQVSKQRLTGILEQWTQGGWFRPTELKASILLQRVQRYLIPLWLVDGRVEGVFRADVGFDYQVVSHRDQYGDGIGWHSQEMKETRIRWEPRVGRVNRFYHNLVVPALDDHRTLMSRVGDFDASDRVEYSPDAASGAFVRVPSLDPETAWPGAEAAFVSAAGNDCRQAAAADHSRDFLLQADYRALNWTLLLLPAYATWYSAGDRIWPVLINGQNGRVSGVRRASARKANTTSLVMGGVAAILFVVGILVVLLGALLAPVAVLGGVLVVISLLLGLAAPIPAISVWVANRSSDSDHLG